MASLMIVQLSCDVNDCSAEWTGEDYAYAVELGWGWELTPSDGGPERDLCPDHAVDPDDLGCCA